jgi:hypothetical protein
VIRDQGTTLEVSSGVEAGDQVILNPPGDISEGLAVNAQPVEAPTGKVDQLSNPGHDTWAIQGWLGHRSITSTAVYTVLAPNRFKDFWRD